MATITSANNNSYKNSPRRSYISVAAFNADFFTYTTSMDANYVTQGTLTAVSGATAANCPKGRVLRENGRKLYPSANPGVTTYLVGVFDDKTFLNGFIDPNSPVFALYNTDKPVYMENGIDPGPGGLTDKGAPVFTNSIVEAGTTITAGTGVIATTGQIRVSTIPSTITISGVSGTGTLNASLGQLFYVELTGSGSPVLDATATPPVGAVVYVRIYNSTGSSLTLTLGANIREIASPSGLASAAGKTYIITFISNGTDLLEVSRTGALV